MDDNLKLLINVGLYIIARNRIKKRKIVRKWWCRPHIQHRLEFGAFHGILNVMEMQDTWSFKNFSRLHPDLFHELESLIYDSIRRQNTNFRQAISVGERLAITLKFLATGKSLRIFW